jgi:hypothetical protein
MDWQNHKFNNVVILSAAAVAARRIYAFVYA